jgi:hypothetical protein
VILFTMLQAQATALLCSDSLWSRKAAPFKKSLQNNIQEGSSTRKKSQQKNRPPAAVAAAPRHVVDLNRMSIDALDIGVHSIPKGTATLELQWPQVLRLSVTELGGAWAKPRSVHPVSTSFRSRYEGRIVAGLDALSEKFAVSPPHYRASVPTEVIDGHIKVAFPSIVSIEWRYLVEIFVASLLYSRELLLEKTCSRNPFFSTPTLRPECFSEADLQRVQSDLHMAGGLDESDWDSASCYCLCQSASFERRIESSARNYQEMRISTYW